MPWWVGFIIVGVCGVVGGVMFSWWLHRRDMRRIQIDARMKSSQWMQDQLKQEQSRNDKEALEQLRKHYGGEER